ncbi:uncharacterized protein Z520_02181 [Fonsecaea multimorphosa CBS 102226]|uniref:Uncharacterized protein n=1 Tax=Fonsecaea multimorphosa CBS 102226 TaxID=1442371 RepID=A0A0D2K7N2_9EURO|nr:uncharacterized protein Z520_02181 [Fonsecaea multimorphosa CBS 102226]KIY02043.1 hypothetical protein Z520_02181 [Fonsecaea multimorphosa CBS 102226]OAL29243.1 hypothetical protein AYO22_02137 [Fonsecaea multimorphosa]
MQAYYDANNNNSNGYGFTASREQRYGPYTNTYNDDGYVMSKQQLQQQQERRYEPYTHTYSEAARLSPIPAQQPAAPPPTYAEAIDESVRYDDTKTTEKPYTYGNPYRYPSPLPPSPVSPSAGPSSLSPSQSSAYAAYRYPGPQPLPSPVSPGELGSKASSFLSPSRSQSSRGLPKPIAIPATLAKYGSPFLRAYPPCLAQYHISSTLFLSFLDTLNRVAVKSPPLQVLSLAGNIAGMVPLQTAQIVGGAVNLASEVSAGVIQHGRTEIELRRANTDIFGPRGLKVEIAKTEALAQLAGMDGVLDNDGKLNKKAALLLPLEGFDAGDAQGDVSGQQRRLDAMKPWIAELDITPLPEIDVPTNAMSRLNVKINERDRRNGEKKLVEKRQKVQREYEKEAGKAQREFDKEMNKINKDLDKHLREVDDKLAEATRKGKSRDISKLEREREKILEKYDRERSKQEHDLQKEMRGVEKERLKDDKEEKNMRKLNWLVIREVNAWSGDGPNPYLPTP